MNSTANHIPRLTVTPKLVSVTISTTPKAGKMIDELVATGLFGDSRDECARRLIERALEGLISEGVLE